VTVRFLLKLVLFILAFGLAYGPYAYYTYLNTGAWMVSEKVGVAYLTGIGLAHGDTTAFDKSTWGLDSTGLETFFFSSESYNVSMLKLILADPQTFVSILYLNASRLVQVLIDWSLFPYVLLPFLVLGLFRRGWTRVRTLKEIFLICSMGPVFAFILFFIQARYLVPLIPVLILWTARGLVDLGEWLTGTIAHLRVPEDAASATSSTETKPLSPSWRTALQITPVLLIMLGLLVIQPRVVRLVNDTGSVRPEHKAVGEHLASIVSRDDVIMARYPAIAYHADARWVPTPNASWPEILRYARHKGVAYFALDERELRYRPQLKDLLTGEQSPPQLVRIYESAAGGERLVVFQLVDGDGN
jgi:hypothetical protein